MIYRLNRLLQCSAAPADLIYNSLRLISVSDSCTLCTVSLEPSRTASESAVDSYEIKLQGRRTYARRCCARCGAHVRNFLFGGCPTSRRWMRRYWATPSQVGVDHASKLDSALTVGDRSASCWHCVSWRDRRGSSPDCDGALAENHVRARPNTTKPPQRTPASPQKHTASYPDHLPEGGGRFTNSPMASDTSRARKRSASKLCLCEEQH